jgi:hypothetical protein
MGYNRDYDVVVKQDMFNIDLTQFITVVIHFRNNDH